MATTLTCAIHVLLGSTWTDIAPDGVATERLSIRYGIGANAPTDVLADTGVCEFSLRNASRNSGGLQGYYSPLHANVRSGWTHGTRVRVVFSNGATTSVSSITRASSTATVTTGSAHGLSTGHYVTIAGAGQAEYNGVFQVTVTGGTTFTYTVNGTPATPATGTITTIRAFIKFQGKIDTIDPEPGQYLTQKVYVTAFDYMRDLHDAEVIDVALQVNQSEDTVIGAVLDALPSANRPLSRSLDAGMDLLAYALDDLGGGAFAAGVLQDLILSSYGLGFIKGDGTFRYVSRNTRATTSSSFTLNNTMRGLRAPSSLSNVFNRVRTTNHPRTADTSDIVLYALTGTPPVIPASSTTLIEGRFRDPSDARRAIGAISTVALASGTDYAGNSAADGSGTDLTADLSISVSVDATRVIFSVQNTGGTPIYLVNASGTTKLQIRGKGVYDNAPRTFETTSGNADRLLVVDLPYSADDGTAQQIGGLIRSQYEDLAAQIDAIELRALTDANITQALEREPGDVLTVTETMTGLSAVEAMILGCRYDLGPENRLTATWSMGPVIDVNPPNPPTSPATSIPSDDEIVVSWSTGSGASGAETLIYRDGLHIATSPAGVTQYGDNAVTRATTYTYTLRHRENALLSSATTGVTGRAIVAATGGTVTTPGDGYKYHTFTTSATFQITTEGRIDYVLAGGGGPGGRGDANGTDTAGGGGGGAGGIITSTDNSEPAGSYSVVIGAGGASGAPPSDGTATTYRSETAAGGGAGGNAGGGGLGLGTAGNNGGSGGGGGATGGANGTATGQGVGNNGGDGFNTAIDNAAGGGGGGGAGSAGSDGTNNGGNGGSAASVPAWVTTQLGAIGVGGKGGRGTGGSGAAGANYGDGGDGHAGAGNVGGNGGNGIAVFRYPI